MFKYKVTDPETGETLVINFDERPTEEDLREAVEKISASRKGAESRSATGVIDAIKDYGILFQGGFQKGMLDLYAMGVSRPAGKLAALFGDEEDGKYYERRAQGFSEAGQELMQEAQATVAVTESSRIHAWPKKVHRNSFWSQSIQAEITDEI